MYPYVIPFSGAAMANDPELGATTEFACRHIQGSGVSWRQATKILPLDAGVRKAILEIEARFESAIERLGELVPHLPSRVRSLVWILSAIPVLERRGCEVPWSLAVAQALIKRLPRTSASTPLVFAMADGRRAG